MFNAGCGRAYQIRGVASKKHLGGASKPMREALKTYPSLSSQFLLKSGFH